MNDPVDIVGVLIALLVLVTSPALAQVIGPYAAIVIVACAGAGLSLSGNERAMTVTQACGYVAIRVLLAVALTVAIARGLEKAFDWAAARYTVVPIAFGIGWVRDYDHVRAWLAEVVERITSKRIGDGK